MVVDPADLFVLDLCLLLVDVLLKNRKRVCIRVDFFHEIGTRYPEELSIKARAYHSVRRQVLVPYKALLAKDLSLAKQEELHRLLGLRGIGDVGRLSELVELGTEDRSEGALSLLSANKLDH